MGAVERSYLLAGLHALLQRLELLIGLLKLRATSPVLKLGHRLQLKGKISDQDMHGVL